MAYAAWSVTFGEQPSAAKWNILGTNDASFNDGTGIGTNAIAAASLKTNAIKLGYAAITADVSTASTTVVAATGLSVTVTVPSGSRSIKITAYIAGTYNSSTNQCRLSIWDGTVGSGTQIAAAFNGNASGQIVPATMMAVATPSAGSKTYNVGYYGSGAGTTYITGATTGPSFILVEAI